jgi:hypothetical protein
MRSAPTRTHDRSPDVPEGCPRGPRAQPGLTLDYLVREAHASTRPYPRHLTEPIRLTLSPLTPANRETLFIVMVDTGPAASPSAVDPDSLETHRCEAKVTLLLGRGRASVSVPIFALGHAVGNVPATSPSADRLGTLRDHLLEGSELTRNGRAGGHHVAKQVLSQLSYRPVVILQ